MKYLFTLLQVDLGKYLDSGFKKSMERISGGIHNKIYQINI